MELPYTTDGGVVTALRKSIRFIPARLKDNPYLAGDTNYLSNLLMLSKLEQRGLLEGRWDVTDIPGQVLRDEIERVYLDKRVCDVPIVRAVAVDTYWDLGRSDATGIWFGQRVGIENRWINYYEDSLVGMSTYIDVLRRFRDEQGISYGTHHLPHDGAVTELVSNTSRQKALQGAKLGPVVIVPRVESIQDGIECLRQAMDTYYFDKTRCIDGIASLKKYRYRYNEQLLRFEREPLHDAASTAADALRQHAQFYKVKRVVTDGDIERARRRGRGTPVGSWRVS